MFHCSDFVSLVSGRLLFLSVSSTSSSEISCFSFAVFSVLFLLTFGELGNMETSVECPWSLLLSLLVRWCLFPFTRGVFPPSVPLYCSLSAAWCWLYIMPLCVGGFAFLSHSTSALQYQVVFLSQTSHFPVPVPGFFPCIPNVGYMHHSCGWSSWTMKCYEFLLFQQMILC